MYKPKNHLSTTSSVYSQDTVGFKRSYEDPIEEENMIEEEEASNPSFTSINNSLLNETSSALFGIRSVESFDSIRSHPDNDETPKLPASYSIDDATPVLNSNTNSKFKDSPLLSPNRSPNLNPEMNQNFPQQNLDAKFKRLSATLQSSLLVASNDSHKFMNQFNDNVRSTQGEHPQTRTSIYYSKINKPLSDSSDEEDRSGGDLVRETSINKLDVESVASSVSNRSSFASNDSHSRKTSSDLEAGSFTFNSELNHSQMNQVHPLKVLNNKSIPIDIDKEVQGLNINYYPNTSNTQAPEPSPVKPKPEPVPVPVSRNSENKDSDPNEDLSNLFVRALHPFDSSTLQSEADASICLAFERDDLAVIHTIDESGWGEVTLVESLQRGWVPMNYFKFAIEDQDDDDDDQYENENDFDDGIIPNSHFLKPLFHACGKFLINPLAHKSRKGKFTFSIRVINMIRDGVRVLLQETDCLSRANEIVTKRPIVRKARKTLLADWYSLMVKANDFKGTSSYNKIEILTLMIYQVLRKAIEFLKIWSIESKQIIKKENERKLQNDMNTYPLLEVPPLAKQRVTEINGILYSYLGLIIGRLDLIEHNSVGCDLLETLTHHIILLLRELLFISKIGSDFSSEKPADLDNSLDNLLSLVSDLVTAVKTLVVSTLNETVDDQLYKTPKPDGSNDYYYTVEGGELIQIAAKMIKAINITVSSIRKLMEITGNFKLNSQRSYPDYLKMRVDPDSFIRQCSIGIAKSNTLKNRQLRDLKPTKAPVNRYSIIRAGKTGDLSLTPNGAGLLHDVLLNDIDDSFSKDKDFEKFTNSDQQPLNDFKVENELLVDAKGNLLGASFKGLVHTLTNEASPPDYFFVSTFFICFRSFANGNDLIEELIGRFDIHTLPQSADINKELKKKNRRRLVAKMFQLWLESYWDFELDYHLLPTLINFFNEGVSQYLPLDSMKLLEIAAKLSSKPLTENTQKVTKKPHKQLISRSITINRTTRKDPDMNLSSRYSMVDGYELSQINTNSSASGSRKSISLPLPLGVGNQTSSASSLLTKNNMLTIEKLNLTYRAIIGNGWCSNNYINDKHFIALDIGSLLPNWYKICEQSWLLSNYRPNLLDFNGLELAKQLTLIESMIFCNIKASELLNDSYTAKKAHLNLAPNVRQSLLFTNCLSEYVIESVLQPKITHKHRLNIVKTWLKVSISCLYLRNFNSLASIITSLQSHLITRITKLNEDLSDKYKELYEYLSGIIHPNKNYTVYRSKLRNFLGSNEYNIPTVPYFPLFLQDLTFISEGNPNHRKGNDFLNKKLINIDKYLKITRIIADIENLQVNYQSNHDSHPVNDSVDPNDYSIIPVPSLQELILLELWKVAQLNKREEDRAWKLSCLIQPRDGSSS